MLLLIYIKISSWRAQQKNKKGSCFMSRIDEGISEMLKDLKEGILQDLLNKLTNDDTLELEFRTGYLSIYYRGGCVSKLVHKDVNCYEDYFDENYNKEREINPEDEGKNQKLQGEIKSSEDCKAFVKEIINRKEIMNSFFAKIPKREREFQQLIERENNDNKESNFYISDIEYARENNRFDMLAVQRIDGKPYSELKLSIIEMKYGAKAIGDKCGIYEHYLGVKNLTKEAIEDIIEDTEVSMQCKNELKLIKAKNYIERGIKIVNNEEIDLIFLISGITLKHNQKLLEELDKVNADLKENNKISNTNIKLNVGIFCTYLAGNVMYDKDILSIDDFFKLHEFRKNLN